MFKLVLSDFARSSCCREAVRHEFRGDSLAIQVGGEACALCDLLDLIFEVPHHYASRAVHLRLFVRQLVAHCGSFRGAEASRRRTLLQGHTSQEYLIIIPDRREALAGCLQGRWDRLAKDQNPTYSQAEERHELVTRRK